MYDIENKTNKKENVSMIGKGVKELRVAINMPAKVLSEKVGISPTYLSRIEGGRIEKTSYETMLNLAQVIADSDAIVEGKVDLDEFDSEFARLVFGCRYKELKRVYEYSREHQFAQEYEQIIKYMNQGDLDTFRTVAKYREAETRFKKVREKYLEMVMLSTKSKNLEEALNQLDQDGIVLGDVTMELPAVDVLTLGYDKFLDIVADRIAEETELLSHSDIFNTKFFETKDSLPYQYGDEEDDQEGEVREFKILDPVMIKMKKQ